MANPAAEILLPLLLALGSAAGLVENNTLTLHAVAGQEIRLQNVWHLNDNCTPSAPIRMVVTSPAGKGTLVAVPVEDFMDGDDTDLMRKCGTRRVVSLDIRYATLPGGIGVDRFGFAAIFEDGTVWNYTVTVQIAQPAPQAPETEG